MSKNSKCLHVRVTALAAGAAFILGASTIAQAAVVYATNFNSPTYSDGPLIGQDGWLITGTSVVNPINVANTGTNGNVSLTTTGQDVNRPYTPAIGGGSAFLSADITLTAAQAPGDYFLHLSDGGTAAFNLRVYARLGSGAGLFQMALATGSGAATLYGADLTIGTTYHILARYDFVAGATNDTGALFINPADPLGVGDTPYVAAQTTGADAVSLSAVCLRQGTAANAPTVTVDNISVAPEPASLLLLAIGGLAAIRRRRA